jgi:hypothetical protein
VGLYTIGLAATSVYATSTIAQATSTNDPRQMERAGIIAGAAAFLPLLTPIVMNPFAVAQNRMMLDFVDKDKRYYKGMLDVFRGIWASQGLVGFYRGLVPMLWAAVAGVGVTSACSMGLIMAATQTSPEKMQQVGDVWVGVTTAVVAASTTPFSIISRQFHLWDPSLPPHMRSSVLLNMDLRSAPRSRLALRRNIAAFGWRGLFRGALAGVIVTWLLALPGDASQKLTVKIAPGNGRT